MGVQRACIVLVVLLLTTAVGVEWSVSPRLGWANLTIREHRVEDVRGEAEIVIDGTEQDTAPYAIRLPVARNEVPVPRGRRVTSVRLHGHKTKVEERTDLLVNVLVNGTIAQVPIRDAPSYTYAELFSWDERRSEDSRTLLITVNPVTVNRTQPYDPDRPLTNLLVTQRLNLNVGTVAISPIGFSGTALDEDRVEVGREAGVRANITNDGDTVSVAIVAELGEERSCTIRDLATSSNTTVDVRVGSAGNEPIVHQLRLIVANVTCCDEVCDDTDARVFDVAYLPVSLYSLELSVGPEQPFFGDEVLIEVFGPARVPLSIIITSPVGEQSNVLLVEGSPGIHSITFVPSLHGLYTFTVGGLPNYERAELEVRPATVFNVTIGGVRVDEETIELTIVPTLKDGVACEMHMIAPTEGESIDMELAGNAFVGSVKADTDGMYDLEVMCNGPRGTVITRSPAMVDRATPNFAASFPELVSEHTLWIILEDVTDAMDEEVSCTLARDGEVGRPVKAKGSAFLTTTVIEGKNGLEACCTDRTGNRACERGTVILDSTPPTFSLTYRPGIDQPIVRFKAVDVEERGSPPATCTLVVDGSTRVPDEGGVENQWTLTLGEGAHAVRFCCADVLGNERCEERGLNLTAPGESLVVTTPTPTPVPNTTVDPGNDTRPSLSPTTTVAELEVAPLGTDVDEPDAGTADARDRVAESRARTQADLAYVKEAVGQISDVRIRTDLENTLMDATRLTQRGEYGAAQDKLDKAKETLEQYRPTSVEQPKPKRTYLVLSTLMVLGMLIILAVGFAFHLHIEDEEDGEGVPPPYQQEYPQDYSR